MGTMRGTNKTGEDPAAVLGLLNKRLMVRPVPDRYCCTLYADYDPQSHQLSFLTRESRFRCWLPRQAAARLEKAACRPACSPT